MKIHTYIYHQDTEREREKSFYFSFPRDYCRNTREVESLHLVLKWVEVGCVTVLVHKEPAVLPTNW